jgi:hypothetical protein
MADIKIDSKLFQERISHFINAWKADKRSGDALFGGASSVVILMGKVDANPEFHKNNAMHVRFTNRSASDSARGHALTRLRSSGSLATNFRRR